MVPFVTVYILWNVIYIDSHITVWTRGGRDRPEVEAKDSNQITKIR